MPTQPAAAQTGVSSLDGIDYLIAQGKYNEVLARAEAVERSTRSPVAGKSGEQDALLTRVELTRGAVWQARGFPGPALTHFERALVLAEGTGVQSAVAKAYGDLASASGDLGRWDRSLDFAERQHEAEPHRTAASECQYLIQRGIAYSEFHDRDRAWSSLQQALVVARASGDARAVSTALGESAAVLLDFDHDVTRALATYDEALTTARQAGFRDLEAAWLLNSGTALQERGDFAGAKARFIRAISVEQANGGHRITPAAMKDLAQVLLHEGARAKAEAVLVSAEHDADAQSIPDLRWQIRIERAVLAEHDAPERAAQLFGEALDILEESQGSVLVEQLRTGRLSREIAAADPYARAIGFFLRRQEIAKAFLTAERGRARAFLETLRSAGDEIARALPPEYVEVEASVMADISEGQAALRGARLSPDERTSLETAIRADEDRLSELRLRLATDRPDIFAVRYPRIWQSEELRKRVLKPRQAMITFFLASPASTCWILDASGLRVVRLPAQAEIEQATRRFLESVRKANDPAEPELASRLFRVLLPDLTFAANVDDLIVVPDGILHYLPFEVLRDSAGHRLLERFTVEYAPSASSFAVIADRGAASPSTFAGVIAIGNPLIKGAATAASRDANIEYVSMLKPLPFTGTEVRGIARVFGSTARVFEGPNATEAVLYQTDLSAVSILHFATHGLLDESKPERSGLVLTSSSPSDDGILQMREVYGLKLRDALVTLSACETALGANVRGEGIIGLSRAFFYAGAGAVVASLWPVDDRSTSEFMIEFYQALSQGQTAAAALRQAKLHFLKGSGRFQAPYYWAAFIVEGNGDWHRAPLPRAKARLIVYVIPMAVALMFGIIVWRRMARRSLL
jgi:CHAT domain-containing protein